MGGLLVLPAVLGLALLAFAVVFRPPRWLLETLSKHLDGTLTIARTDERAIALTIDDAPHPLVTPGILDVLRRHGARATFFVIGEHAARHPDLVEAVRAEGHELANHLYRDRPTIRLSEEAFGVEAARTDALIACGRGARDDGTAPSRIRWCRPGSGLLSKRLVARMRRHGYWPCLASAYPLDLRLGRAVASLQLRANVRPGAVLVLHDGATSRRRTVATLEGFLPRAIERGYRLVTLSELAAMARPDERRRSVRIGGLAPPDKSR